MLTVVLVAGIAIYIVFSPKHLTPIAHKVADNFVTCEYEIGEVDLTFFSTFPYFGASIKDVYLINPMEGAQNDTLLAVPELIASVKIFDAINGDIYIKQLQLSDAKANIYIAPDGTANYDVFSLSTDTTEQDTTAGGWQLRSLGWDEDIKVNAKAISFVDEKDTISASMNNVALNLSTLERKGMQGALLDLQADNINASLKSEQYADSLKLKIHLPALLADGSERIIVDGTKLQVNEFGLELDGELGSPCFASGIYTMDLTLATNNKWAIKPLLNLVPEQFTAALSDLDVDGNIKLEATAKGTYADSIMPVITAHLVLSDGKGSYKPIPYTLRDIKLDANVDLDLNNGGQSNVEIKKLAAATKQSKVSAKGKVNDLLGDMLIDMQLALDANIPDFDYFLPQNMDLTGNAEGNAKVRIRLNDLTAMKLEKGNIVAELNLNDIHYSMDSIVADLPRTKAHIVIPNKQPSQPKLNWVKAEIETEKVDYEMAMPLKAALKQSAITLEAGNVLSNDPVLYAGLTLDSKYPVNVEMDSIAAIINAPKMTAYAEYNTKDTTIMPVIKATLDYDALTGHFKEIYADLKASQLSASISGGRKDKSAPVLRAKLNTNVADVKIGDELHATTGALALEAGARYKAEEENILLQWNPRLKVNLKNGMLSMPDRIPEDVKIPSIEFGYSNREMTIENSRVELGHSDLNLKGNVRNIGKWFRHDSVLIGELDIISDHCDANQLLTWFSADSGSEEQNKTPQTTSQAKADVTTPQEQKPDSVKEIEPFLVPTDVNLALNTHIREVEIFNQVAKDLKGGLYIKDGVMILDEMGFVCHAAKLQLTAMYRTPRRNHIYVGLDYHMLDVNIDELLEMIPDIRQMVPMLQSFKGEAQFHLAAETFLTSQYEPKMSTLRGAASLTGKDLVVLDGETFSKISKLLLFKKKTENKIDSLNAELTVYKNEIDIYPLCVSMDNYMVALGGRHKTDMTFDYDINVLKPIYLGVHVGGNLDNLNIKLAKCKYAKDFRPHWYQKADSQSLELRQMIKSSLEKNVRIK